MEKEPTEVINARVGEAVRLFLLEHPLVAPEMARSIVQLNGKRGIRDVDELIGIEQYANAHSNAE